MLQPFAVKAPVQAAVIRYRGQNAKQRFVPKNLRGGSCIDRGSDPARFPEVRGRCAEEALNRYPGQSEDCVRGAMRNDWSKIVSGYKLMEQRPIPEATVSRLTADAAPCPWPGLFFGRWRSVLARHGRRRRHLLAAARGVDGLDSDDEQEHRHSGECRGLHQRCRSERVRGTSNQPGQGQGEQ